MKRSLGHSLILVALIARCPPSEGQCHRYSVEVVQKGCSFGNVASATDLSEDGIVTGWYSCGASTIERPFSWTNGVLTNLPWLPNAQGGRALANEIGGQIVGRRLMNTNRDEAFAILDGQLFDLGVLPGANTSEARAINSSRIVCGFCNNTLTGPLRSFCWDGQMTELVLPASAANVANGISDDGTICGWIRLLGESNNQGYLWKNGVVTLFGAIPGGSSSEAVAINNNGEVVVKGLTNDLTPRRRSFLWRNGTWTNLGLLPGGVHCDATDINDHTEIVGSSNGAFIWRDGVMTRLNDLIPPGTNVNIRGASAINNIGAIAAEGWLVPNTGETGSSTSPPTVRNPSPANAIATTTSTLTTWSSSSPTGAHPGATPSPTSTAMAK